MSHLHSVQARTGAQTITIETGEIARQASGSVVVRSGGMLLLCTVVADRRPTRLDYMPLTCEYRLRMSAAGRIPGSYDRRETRATEYETLTARLIDRSLRPFFPDTWNHDTQVIVQPLAFESGSDPDVLGITAASTALLLSDVPWGGPTAGVRVALVDDELVAFPDGPQRGRARLDLVVTVSESGIVMVEGGAHEISEDRVLAAFELAHEAAQPLLQAQRELAEHGAPKRELREKPSLSDEQASELRSWAEPRVAEALTVTEKLERHQATDAAIDDLVAELPEQLGDEASDETKALAARLVKGLPKRLIREGILAGRRLGQRGLDEVRDITGRTGWLESCHGSSLFTRGETQAIVTCTLGNAREAKSTETLDGERVDRFLLHYNFPPYCVAEVKPLRGPGRREVGHGHLARRALEPVLPDEDAFPQVIRLESLITESNGSSSMATVCGGCLALLDAGVPLRAPVAGIAMGLVKEGDELAVLSDILGDEDHVGDMDFKVCGTATGVTAIQLDNKLGALPPEVMTAALTQAREARLHVLERMEALRADSPEGSRAHVPRSRVVRIERNRIGSLIGPAGRHVKAIRSELGVEVEVGDDGRVVLAGHAAELSRAESRVNDLAGIPRLDEVLPARVVTVREFGSFVRLFEGIEALLHGAQLEVDQKVQVKVTGADDRGRLQVEKVG